MPIDSLGQNVTTVNRWGNSQGVRLPMVFCRQLGIDVGDELVCRIEGNTIILEKKEHPATIRERMRHWGKRGETQGGAY